MANKKMPGFNPFLFGLIALSFLIGILLYDHLPEKVPMHWNIYGEIDAYENKFVGAFSLPFLTLVIYTLMIWLPKIDPKRMNYPKFAEVYNVFVTMLVLFLLSIYALVLLASFGYRPNVGVVVRIGLGIIFIVSGNYLGRVRHNYFFGIKTPWTLASETVWRKTHRLGGILFVAAGALTIISIFLNSKIGFFITIGSLISAAVITTVYSCLIYKFDNSE